MLDNCVNNIRRVELGRNASKIQLYIFITATHKNNSENIFKQTQLRKITLFIVIK